MPEYDEHVIYFVFDTGEAVELSQADIAFMHDQDWIDDETYTTLMGYYEANSLERQWCLDA